MERARTGLPIAFVVVLGLALGVGYAACARKSRLRRRSYYHETD